MARNVFTVSIAQAENKSYAVDVAYEGPKPAWLKDSGRSVFPGRLVLVQAKDFDANKRAR